MAEEGRVARAGGESGRAAEGARAIPEGLVPPDCADPVVLGIDPGTRVVGYGAVLALPRGPRFLACGVLRARSRDGTAPRLAHLHAELTELLRRIRPSAVVVESAFAARDVRAALRIGEGRGVALAAAAARGCAVAEYAPAVAKKAVLGHGGATKAQVRTMVASILGLDARTAEVPDDATDALSLALAHLSRMRLDAALRGRRQPPRW